MSAGKTYPRLKSAVDDGFRPRAHASRDLVLPLLALRMRGGAAMTEKLRLLSLFAGIGGFELGLERSGYFETVAQCEIDPFCRRVLEKHWPNVRRYEDVRELTAARLASDGIALTQFAADSHAKTSAMLETVKGSAASVVASGLNMTELLARFDRDSQSWKTLVPCFIEGLNRSKCLAARGYDAWWDTISAKNIGLPHERERVWIMAYSDEVGRKACERIQALLISEEMLGIPATNGTFRARSGGIRWLPNGIICSVNNGLSANVDGLGAAGNAVVPQIPELLGRAYGQAMMERAP